ncbi:MAG: hypothetical protein ACREX0_10260, partial [Noviherbaspirillum sp.]
EYIAELHDKKMIPPDIYGPDVKTLVEPELVSDTFKQHGFKRNLEGGPDLGAFSGTNPLVEAVKARAITATFGLILAQTNSLATS